MYGALLLFESEFVHIVAISFTSLILTELLMVALTIQTWHWLMTVAELLSLACYIASLVFLHEFIGKTPAAIGTYEGRQPPQLTDARLCAQLPPFSSWGAPGARGRWESAFRPEAVRPDLRTARSCGSKATLTGLEGASV